MNYEKQFRRFKKEWQQGKYKKTVCIGAAAVLAVCAVLLGRYYLETRQADSAMAQLRKAKEEARLKEGEGKLAVGTQKIQTVYEDLFLQNPDLIGWLTIDGTKIDYPVMWTPEDVDYYSSRGFDKEESKNGLLFLDGGSDINDEGGNLIIYGHNMKNGSMFADLLSYKKESYWKSHPAIQLDTLYDSRLYEVAAVISDNDFDNLPYAFANSSDEKVQEVIEAMKTNVLYDTGVELSYGDDFLTLSTCDYSMADGRLVVIGRRVQ